MLTNSPTQKLIEIENKYQTYNNESWWYLRGHYSLALEKNLVQDEVRDSNLFLQKIMSLFGYMKCIISSILRLGVWFNRYDLVVFDVSDNFIELSGALQNRFTSQAEKYFNQTLHIQSVWGPHIKGDKDYCIIDSNIVKIAAYVLRKFGAVKLTESVYAKINEDMQLSVDAAVLYSKMVAMKKITKLILRIYRPRLVITTSYLFHSELIAAKELGIPTVEVQHGIINIPAYAGNNFNKKYQPDFMFVFGEHDKKFLRLSNYIHNGNNILPVGSSLLDDVNAFSYDVLSEYREQYEVIVSISCQDTILDETIRFISQVAQMCPTVLFVMIPRTRVPDIESYISHANIIVLLDYSCQQIVKCSDWHLTVYSTCAYEAASLGTPTMLWNYQSLSEEYLSDYFKSNDFVTKVDDVHDVIRLLNQKLRIGADKLTESNTYYYAQNYGKCINDAINMVLKA